MSCILWKNILHECVARVQYSPTRYNESDTIDSSSPEYGFTFIAKSILDVFYPLKTWKNGPNLVKNWSKSCIKAVHVTSTLRPRYVRDIHVTYGTWLSFDLWHVFWALGTSWDVMGTYTRCLRVRCKILYRLLVSYPQRPCIRLSFVNLAIKAELVTFV